MQTAAHFDSPAHVLHLCNEAVRAFFADSFEHNREIVACPVWIVAAFNEEEHSPASYFCSLDRKDAVEKAVILLYPKSLRDRRLLVLSSV